MRKATLYPNGNWYKGNTHTHSTVSDGKYTPQELMSIYREEGYSFLAITDHAVYSDYSQQNRPDFLTLPGVELHCFQTKTPRGALGHHIVGLGLPGQNKFEHGYRFEYDCSPDKGATPDELIQWLTKGGNVCIYAHPYWHRVKAAELLAIDGIFGLETYNHTCQLHSATGNSEGYLDHLLWEGRRAFTFASDDTHGKGEAFGGFVMVKAPELTHEAVMKAILDGSFYSSTGPAIEDFYVEDGTAVLTCSPCRMVGILADNMVGRGETNPNADLTRLVYPLNGKEQYVRAVCEDAQGHRALSQPIWID